MGKLLAQSCGEIELSAQIIEGLPITKSYSARRLLLIYSLTRSERLIFHLRKASMVKYGNGASRSVD
jgi:hypothetical protein